MTTFSFKTLSLRHQRKRVLPCPKCKDKQKVICWGFQHNYLQRYRCKKCKCTFNKKTGKFNARLRTLLKEVTRCVASLCDGQGLRACSRTSNHKRATLVNWLQSAGKQCQSINEKLLKPAASTFLELDELYTYVYTKQFRQYLWTSVDAFNKLFLGFHLSWTRSLEECKKFFHTFLHRVQNVLGATSDGLQEYATLMQKYFSEVPFAQVVKVYQNKRLVEVKKKQCGKHTVASVEYVLASLGLGSELNTSAVERFNSTLRSFLARLNRKTVKFSKDKGNLEALLHVFQAYYNLCLRHSELRTSPAHAAGLTKKRLTLQEVLSLRV